LETDSPTLESLIPTYSPTEETYSPTILTEAPATESPIPNPVIVITASNGGYISPYFNFEVDGSALDVESYEFIPGSKYKFVGGSSIDDHPFFVSDQGRLTASSFDITSTKAYNTGIKVDESLEFQLPSDFSGTLTYYCVPHDIMTNTFKVASPTTTTMNTRFEVSFEYIINISFCLAP
jgi:hypothetical protein